MTVVDADIPADGFRTEEYFEQWARNVADDVTDLMFEQFDEDELATMPKEQIDEFVSETPALNYDPKVVWKYVDDVRQYARNAHVGHDKEISVLRSDFLEEVGLWVNEIIVREVADHTEIEIEARGIGRGDAR